MCVRVRALQGCGWPHRSLLWEGSPGWAQVWPSCLLAYDTGQATLPCPVLRFLICGGLEASGRPRELVMRVLCMAGGSVGEQWSCVGVGVVCLCGR